MHQPGWLSGAMHFVIIAVAFQADSAKAWPYALLAMSAVSFFAWVANYRRYRDIQDLPTSKVASAAQGYVELFGRTALLPGEPIRSRLSRSPCCWYSYEIQEKGSDNKWNTADSGSSVEQFLLVDETGQCVISPEGAEVVTHDQKSWEELDRRYNEWLLLPKSVVYAIGEFSTTTADAVSARDERADAGALRATLGSLFALAEAYPDLKTNQTFQQLQTRISSLENGIADRREFYNESVNVNNVRIEQFPDSIIAGMFDFKPAHLLEIQSEEKTDVDVKKLFGS